MDMLFSKLENYRIRDDEITSICPFHHETQPSFRVNLTKGLYNCFGCGAHGNLPTLYSKLFDMSYLEAKVYCNKMWKVDESSHKPLKVDDYLTLPGTSQNFTYLNRRGITDETCREFKIKHSVTRQSMVFPVLGSMGEALGWQERFMNGKGYKNSPKLDRRRLLYPMWKVDLDLETVYVVEGLVDCLWMWQNGYPALATFGASVTPEQIAWFDKFNEIVILFDNDEAGHRGAKTIQQAIPRAQRIVPTAKDVNDMSAEDLKNLIERSKVDCKNTRSASQG